ncbi:hypothetical protein AAMO2058_001285600 [Amorphochlora amoebiformis]
MSYRDALRSLLGKYQIESSFEEGSASSSTSDSHPSPTHSATTRKARAFDSSPTGNRARLSSRPRHRSSPRQRRSYSGCDQLFVSSTDMFLKWRRTSMGQREHQ